MADPQAAQQQTSPQVTPANSASTPSTQPTFDVDGARKAGYSDDEILQHLTQTRNFNVNGALQSGYSKPEIINYLAGAPATVPASTGGPAAPNDYLTKTEDFIHGFGGGALKNIPFLGKYLGGNYSQQGVVNPDVAKMGEGAGRIYEQGLEMAATGGPLKAGAENVAARLPVLGRLTAPVARTAAEAINAGANAYLHGQPVGTSAALGGGGAAAGKIASAIAPKVAETALGITDRMRGRGRTVGQAVLNETSGIRPGTIAEQAQDQSLNLTRQMEGNVHQATVQGAMGSSQPAHNVLNQAIQNTPRNAHDVIDKLNDLYENLDLRPRGSVGPVPTSYTPDELLEMKRGIGKTISKWPAEWQNDSDVLRLKQQLYGALDGELDRLVPGNAELNQRISSLIPAAEQATRKSLGAGVTQKVAGRIAAHTGALTLAGLGGKAGYEQGGLPGALTYGTAGLVAPEILASPTGQMAIARLMQMGIPQQVARGIVASQQRSPGQAGAMAGSVTGVPSAPSKRWYGGFQYAQQPDGSWKKESAP